MLWLPGRQKYVSHHRASLKDTPCQRLRGEASGLLCAGTAAAWGKVLGTLLRDGSWMNEANLTAVGAQKNSSAVLECRLTGAWRRLSCRRQASESTTSCHELDLTPPWNELPQHIFRLLLTPVFNCLCALATQQMERPHVVRPPSTHRKPNKTMLPTYLPLRGLEEPYKARHEGKKARMPLQLISYSEGKCGEPLCRRQDVPPRWM